MLRELVAGCTATARRWCARPHRALLVLGGLAWLAWLPEIAARLPQNDYWAITPLLVPNGELEVDLQRFWRARFNEHRVALVMPLWAANLWAFAGSNRPPAVLALALLLALAWLLVRALPRPAAGWARWLIAGLGCALVLGPASGVNVAMSFAGLTYWAADLLAVVAIRTCLLAPTVGRRIVTALAPVAATAAFSSGLALAPVLFGLSLVLRRRWLDCALPLLAAAGSVLVSGLVGRGREIDAALVVRYAVRFVGAGISSQAAWAELVGAVVLLLFACGALATLVARRASPRARFWLGVACYFVLLALMAGVGRAERLGLDQALAVRYVLYGRLVVLAVLGLLLSQRPWRHGASRRVVIGGAVVMVVAGGLARDLPIARALERQRAELDWSEVVLRQGLYLDPKVPAYVSVAPHQVARQLEPLAEVGHVPFDRPAELLGPRREPWAQPREQRPMAGAILVARPARQGELVYLEVRVGDGRHRPGRVRAIDAAGRSHGHFLPVLTGRGWVVRGLLERATLPLRLPRLWAAAGEGEALRPLDVAVGRLRAALGPPRASRATGGP